MEIISAIKMPFVPIQTEVITANANLDTEEMDSLVNVGANSRKSNPLSHRVRTENFLVS